MEPHPLTPSPMGEGGAYGRREWNSLTFSLVSKPLRLDNYALSIIQLLTGWF